MSDQEEPTGAEIEVERRMDLLDLVIDDLRVAIEVEIVDAAKSEAEKSGASPQAALRTVTHLLHTAAHIAAHDLVYAQEGAFEAMMLDIVREAIDARRECATVLPLSTEKKGKHLS